LSLMVAQKNSKIQIQAIDVQKGAIQDAAFNFQNCSYSNRLKEIHEDFLAFDPNQKFDLIFTNPPFYADAKLGASDQLNQAKHILEMTPKALFQKVKSALEETGSFWIIWPFQASSEIITVASKYGLYPQVCMVINGKPSIPTRIILEFGFQREEIIEREITIRTHSGDYSDEYKNLTKDFHNKTL
jgi:tRNA1Val (adenine37-N6)-methyltransferase